jgi:RNA polymerase sigma factor (sigma-70 family)
MAAKAYIYSQEQPNQLAMIRHLDNTETELLEGCKRSDRLMQEKFYKHFHGTMLAVCLRYTKDRETALDIMNRGFLRVFKKIGDYKPTGSLEGWIRVIMIHAIADYFRQKKTLPVVFSGELPEDRQVFIQESQHFTKEELQKAIYQLAENQRLVFNLFAIEGYPHKEIAGLLNMNENTVRWVYGEAKKKLQQILTHLL